MTPAEELAQSADKLDALIAGASVAPWAEPYEGFTPDDAGWWVHNGGDGMSEHAVAVTLPYSPNAEADARYIAAMNPLVGKALAEWLRQQAGRVAELDSMLPAFAGASSPSLSIARLINGRAS